MAHLHGIHSFKAYVRLAVALLAVGAVASCSSYPKIIGDENKNPLAPTRDAGVIDGSTTIFHGDGGTSNCKPKTCTDLGADCGDTVDGCNNVLHCGSCAADEACSIMTANVCTKLASFCKPIAQTDACMGKACGLEGDGCGGQYDCGSCPTGSQCGYDTPFQCTATGTTYDKNHCPAKIASCASVGDRCGVIGNGCGGTIDCNAELGACPSGTLCSAVTPYQCGKVSTPVCTPATSCADLGWACGLAIDSCGNVFDCSKEGRTCGPLQTCVGGITGPTTCETSTGTTCPLCSAVPDCTGKPLTKVTGRVISPGRADDDTGNQVGVPNAFVYIVRADDVTQLPAITTGIPATGTSCDRCDAEDLGPVLASATTDAKGDYTLSGDIPVGKEFLLVVKAGKFRRAVEETLPATAACKTTPLTKTLPGNPTRLPRTRTDGLAVNIPHIAVTTGEIDAMECVFEKMGIADSEFVNPGANGKAAGRVHMYRGGPDTGTPPGRGGAIDANTPQEDTLYGSLARILSYDMIVADCEGASWDSSFTQRDADGASVQHFVNAGGRLFASHLRFSWLDGNGTQAYSAAKALTTGLDAAGTWDPAIYTDTSGTGEISIGRPNASPTIRTFAAWASNETIAMAPNYQFTITDPRSNSTGLGASSEEFVYRTDGNGRTQQFSFNTPYGAPAAAVCGRVAYSGFHVAATGGSSTPFVDGIFPQYCAGELTPQEKVLLYMLFDLGSCIGNPPPPPSCTAGQCPKGACGTQPDGCGGSLDCGACPPACKATTCAAQKAVCGQIGDGCGALLNCGNCPPGQICGVDSPNQCGNVHCTPETCAAAGAACGNIGDGCGGLTDCGDCPPGQVCGFDSPYQCGTPPCTPTTCQAAGAECGPIPDGCGMVVDCGPCPAGAVCGATTPNQCSGGIH